MNATSNKKRSPLSIVICAYNGLEYTKLLLWSLREHSKFQHEIVVYSDGSSDGTLAWLRAQPDIRWRHDRTNRGICTAMNRAAKIATREYMFFPNTDHVLAPGWDEALVPRLAERRVVSLQCIEPGIVPVASIFHAANCGTRHDEFDRDRFREAAARLRRDAFTPGVNYPFVISRALWNEVGALDERFDPGPANDPDLWYRLHLLGVELVRAEDVIAYHFSGKSSRMADEATSERRAWHEVTVRNEARFAEKWGERYRYANGGLPDPGPEARRRWETSVRPPTTQRIEVTSPVRVLFDARSIRPDAQGIGIYSENLVRALARLPEAPAIRCVTPNPEVVAERVGQAAAVHGLSTGEWNSQRIDEVVGGTGATVFHGPSFVLPEKLSIASVITIHDVMFLRHPEWYSDVFASRLGADLRKSLGEAGRAIAVSDAARHDTIRLLNVDPGKVRRIYEACPEDAVGRKSSSKEELREKYAAGAPYIVSIGVQHRRKNALGLLRAYARLKRAMPSLHRLVLVGAKECEDPVFRDELEKSGLAGDVTLTSHLTRPELLDVLSGAELLVYPSLGEGFGLPLLEAMACDVPVVCSNAPSLPEVAGDAARMCDPADPESIAEAMRAVLANPAASEELVARGRARRAAFSWETAARETLAVYREAIESRRDLGRISSPRSASASGSPRQPLRVAVDARLLGAVRMGTGRYTTEILRALLRHPRLAEFVLIGPAAIDIDLIPDADKVLQTVPAGSDTLLNPVWEQYSLPTHLLGCDVYFAPTGIVPVARPCRALPVIHDLGFEDHPEFYPDALRHHLKRWLANSCRSSERLVAVSQFTAGRVAAEYGVPPDRIDVVHHGCTSSLAAPVADAPTPELPYVLCVSSFEANKNLASLVEAFAGLESAWSGKLILAGREGRDLENVRRRVAELSLESRVELAIDPDDGRLAHLYRRASAFAYPSLYEGFGLPLVEALAAGLPIVTVQATSCAEVVGEGALVVDDGSTEALQAGLRQLLSDEDLSDSLRSKAMERSKHFTWERAAEATWAAIDRCLEA